MNAQTLKGLEATHVIWELSCYIYKVLWSITTAREDNSALFIILLFL